MDTLRRKPAFEEPMELKWSSMVVLSLVLHVAAFSTILLAPGYAPPHRLRGTIYEVDLVEWPLEAVKKSSPSNKAVSAGTAPRKKAPAKRIAAPKAKEKPVVVAKRTLEKKSKATDALRKKTPPPAALIDSRLKRPQAKEDDNKKDHVNKAIEKIEAKVQQDKAYSPSGRGSSQGISMTIYRMEVESWIKGNWSYPVSLGREERGNDLEAVVIVKVRNDGTILNSRFQSPSSNIMFDTSVLRAVERSNPLPGFPEGYRKTTEELQITFNLSELEHD